MSSVSLILLPHVFLFSRTLSFFQPTAPAKRILSLRDPSQKMSKSAPNVSSRILITDSYADITSKIKSAVTDSTRGITYSPSTRPGISNLLIILASCRGEDPLQIAAAYESAGKSHAELKKDVIDAVEMTLAPIRKRYSKIKGDVVYLRDVSESGASRARSLASETMREVKLKMGLQLL